MPPASHPGLRPRYRVLVAAILLAPLLLAVARMTGSEVERALARVPLPDTHAAAPADLPPDRNGYASPVLGFAINAHHIGDLPLYLRSVADIHALGANTLIVVTPMYQERVDSDEIRHLRSKCPTDEQLTAILIRGKQLGLTTVLMPIVLLEEAGEKDWRGVIRPKSWDRWWDSYGAFMDRYVAIANEADVDVLSVGSELNSTEAQRDRWRALIDHVRSRFDGQLTYSSNWDRYEKVALWPMVDVISISSYFELERDRHDAPVADLVAAWAPVRRDVLAFARDLDRPVVLSELGYPSLPWAAAHPWNYIADGTTADHDAQARAWTAFFEAWSDVLADPDSPVLGVCGYRWDPYHRGGSDDTGYGIVGKPAHAVVRRGFASIERRMEASRESR